MLGKAGFTAEDSQKWVLADAIPARYRPWMRASNPTGYFTQKIIDAQKPSSAEREAQRRSAVEVNSPAFFAKLAASDAAFKKTQSGSILGNTKRLGTVATDLGKGALSYAGSIPGIGTVVGAAGNALVAVAEGKSLASIASAAAKGAIPGGPLVRAAVVAATNVAAAGVQGHNMAKAAAHEVVNAAVSLAPGPVQGILRDSVNAGLSGKNILSAAKASVVASALNQLPPEARQVVKIAVQGVKNPASLLSAAPGNLVGAVIAKSPAGALASTIHSATQAVTANVQKAKDMRPLFGGLPTGRPEIASGVRVPFGTPRPTIISNAPSITRLRVAHQPLTDRAKGFLRARTGHDVAGLNTNGTWQVMAGDTGMNIAKRVVGDANRWKELIVVNPKNMTNSADVKAYGFPVYTYKYNPINLPTSWIKVAPSPAPVPAGVPSAPPAIQAPAGDLAAMTQARVELLAWSSSDGKGQAGVTDYGTLSDMATAAWMSRDKFQAASFENWWNKSGFAPMPVDGEFTNQLAGNLLAWTERRASQTVPVTPAAPPTPSPQPSAPVPAPVAAQPAPVLTPQQILTNLPAVISSLPSLLNPAASPAASPTPASPIPSVPATWITPGVPPVQASPPPSVPGSTSPAQNPPRAPLSPAAKGGIMTAAGLLGTIIGPAISKAMFGSAAPPSSMPF